MIRRLEKKNWRKNVEECWEVSNKLEACVNNSDVYKAFNVQTNFIFSKSIGKSFLNAYLNNWADGRGFVKAVELFYNPDSEIWTPELVELRNNCNLYALKECCEQKYNLDNLDGDYEWIGGSLTKK
jgi:hypothetical protein